MMKRGLPIYGKLLAWLAVNVLVIALLIFGFLRLQFRLSLDWMLAGPTGESISILGENLTRDLANLPETEWAAQLDKQGVRNGVTFALFDSDGRQVMGSGLEVPPELKNKLVDKRPWGVKSPPKRPGRGQIMRPSDAPPKPRFIQRAGDPARYWAGIHLDLTQGREGRPLTFVMVSDSITGGGLFFDLWPFIGLGIAGLVVSALVWIPFVRGLTQSIKRLNTAARSIAQGHFTERVIEKRSDELGELASSVNAMAGQLGDYVDQQRRITSDVAHELCSPIARMQMALGIVEQRSTPEQTNYLKKLDGELQHMAKLVEEVLAFSKAETLPERVSPTEVNLNALIQGVLSREAAGYAVDVHMLPDITLVTLPEALDRALGNVLRNAIRYAGHAGKIEIHATQSEGKTQISVTDEGPGVPPEALARLFEPFYRPEAARGRQTGGSGLGLAIVKRCLEACGGSVTAKLRRPTGLEVELTLP